MNLDAARRATRRGAIAGFIHAGLVLAWLLVNSFGLPGAAEYSSDPWNLVDVPLIAALAYAVRRNSRAGAIALFLFLIHAFVYSWVTTGRPFGIVVMPILLYFYVKAIVGSFAYHRLRRQADASYRAAPRWMYFVGPPILLVALAMFALGTAIEMNLVPSASVVPGHALRQSDVDLLLSENILGRDEKVILFYSGGLISIRERGSILTDQRVVSYEDYGTLVVQSARYDEIDEIANEPRENAIFERAVGIAKQNGDKFQLLVSTEDEGDAKLIDELSRRWKSAR